MSYLFKATGLSLRHGGEAELTETKYEIMPLGSGHCADVAVAVQHIFFFRTTSKLVEPQRDMLSSGFRRCQEFIFHLRHHLTSFAKYELVHLEDVAKALRALASFSSAAAKERKNFSENLSCVVLYESMFQVKTATKHFILDKLKVGELFNSSVSQRVNINPKVGHGAVVDCVVVSEKSTPVFVFRKEGI